MKAETSNEQLILEAAEAEFLEKGYHSAKTTAIAERAGVTHAMLHYYFRTKENLFNVVFQRKLEKTAELFIPVFRTDAPFEEVIRSIMESQFELLAANPQLMNFVYNESISSQVNRDSFMNFIIPKVEGMYLALDRLLQAEIARGAVRPIETLDLLLNMAALNTMSFKAGTIVYNSALMWNEESITDMLKERKESNIQFVLHALRPEKI